MKETTRGAKAVRLKRVVRMAKTRRAHFLHWLGPHAVVMPEITRMYIWLFSHRLILSVKLEKVKNYRAKTI